MGFLLPTNLASLVLHLNLAGAAMGFYCQTRKAKGREISILLFWILFLKGGVAKVPLESFFSFSVGINIQRCFGANARV